MSKQAHERVLEKGEGLLRSWGLHPSSPLSDLAARMGRDAAADAALAHWLGSRPEAEAVALLEKLAAAEDKTVRREARRALYRLEQRGLVSRAAPQEVVARPFLEAEPAVTEAYFSQYFSTGERELFFVRKGSARLLVLFAITRDYDHSLRELRRVELSRKQWRASLEDSARGGYPLAKGDAAHCDALLWRAYENVSSVGQPISVDYAAVRSEFFQGPPLATASHPLTQIYPEAELAEVPIAARQIGERLLNEKAVLSLAAGLLDRLREFVERIREVQASPLVLTDVQKQERQAQIVAQAIDTVFAPAERPSWVHRLREVGYYVHLMGKSSVARELAATAFALEKPGIDPKQVAFCRAAVETLIFIELYERELAEAERAKESLIVTPDRLVRAARAAKERTPRR
ncbi:MAG: hypothetical protein N3C12_07725 [Candidatus Binatia bacterium]|nr:hypothetical protein [Candidatus Binatia bacterium]